MAAPLQRDTGECVPTAHAGPARGQSCCPMLRHGNILHLYTAPEPPRRPAKGGLRASVKISDGNWKTEFRLGKYLPAFIHPFSGEPSIPFQLVSGIHGSTSETNKLKDKIICSKVDQYEYFVFFLIQTSTGSHHDS